MCEGCFEENTDFYGADLKSISDFKPKNEVGCQMECQRDANCKYFTYAYNRCLLKSKSSGRRKYNGAVSGARFCSSKPRLSPSK